MANIEIQNLTKSYGKTVAVNDVSLKVKSGTFTVILGPSGSGKTTLLRCVAGFEKPDSGAVIFDGKDFTNAQPKDRDLAMVFQSYALFPLMTIHDNIAFPLKIRNASKAEIHERVTKVADLLVIKHILDKRPSQLSGGEQQRAALGRAIVREPSALLMDEPLTSLDAPLRAQMRTELKRIRRETKMTAIYVTHDQAEAMGLADTLAIMNFGRLVQYDEPLEMYSRPSNTFVAGFIGSPPTNLIEAKVETGSGEARLRIENIAFPLDSGKASKLNAMASGTITVGIRPEDIRAYPSKNSERSLETTVDSTEPLGSSVVVNALLGDSLFKLVLPPDRKVRPGEHLWIEWESAKMYVFDGTGNLIA
jgi:ABC-type sugar transport system ATPase subunit